MPDLSNSPSFQMKRELLLLLFLVNIVIAWIVVSSRELGVFWNLQDSKEQQHLQQRGNSIGRQIVEASYHNSGYKDFVDKFCPQDTTIESHDGFQAKFVNNCLKKAQEAGNTIGSEYNQKWPWWFHTLLRDGNFFFSATMDSIVRRNRTKGIAKLYFSFFLTITVISFGLFFRTLAASLERAGLGLPRHTFQFKGVGGVGKVGKGAIGKEPAATSPRLQLCVYPKGGIKNWRKLHCEHNDDYLIPYNAPGHTSCTYKQPPYDVDWWKEIGLSKADTRKTVYRSQRAVFLRDPLSRFLSGFLDKCARKREQKHCEPIGVYGPPVKGSAMESMKKDNRLTFQAYVDTFPLTWNMHFLPQSFYCGGLYRMIEAYDFVGSMDSRFYYDLDTLQKKYPGLEPGIESVYRVREKLPAHNTTTVTNTGVETGAANQLLDFYTPHTVRKVLEYYAMDYKLLGIPIPEWAEKMLLESSQGS